MWIAAFWPLYGWSWSGDGVDWLCVRLRNMIGTYGLLEHNYPLFQNVVMRQGTIHSGTKFNNFIDRDPHWYTHRVKEATYIRLHPDNINRDSRIEIPEAWMPTIKQHNTHSVPTQTTEGTISCVNDKDNWNPPINNSPREDQNAPITANRGATYTDI